MGGGDEAYLSRIFLEQGIRDHLTDFEDKKVYMGISAGSVVAGVFFPKGLNIEPYGEECESDDGVGMGLCDFVIVPHLNSPYFPGVTTKILETKLDRFASRFIAVDDFTAVSVNQGQVTYIGDGERMEYSK